MFICDFCNRVSKPTESANYISTKVRTRVYKYGNHGSEAVEEKKACKPCAVDRNDQQPEVVGHRMDQQEDRPYEDDEEAYQHDRYDNG